MSERINQSESISLNHLITQLEFDIESRIKRDATSNWLEAFRNIYTVISGRITLASMGLENQLPDEHKDDILKLNTEIIYEARINRSIEDAQKVLIPLVKRLSDLLHS